MKLNANVAIVGRHVCLVPYAARHVAKHHAWMQIAGNRLDRAKTAPSFAQEESTQTAWENDPNRCVFLIMDYEAASDVTVSEMNSLIGECHLILSPDKQGSALLEMMCIDGTVRRKAIISESLLLLLSFGVSQLQLDTYNVILDPNAEPNENRLIFGARDELDESGPPAPAPSAAAPAAAAAAAAAPAENPRRGENRQSIVGKLTSLYKEAFKSSKTDYLHRLTRHLLRQDEGDHWPEELDFVLVAPNFLELKITAAAHRALLALTSSAWRIKFSSMRGDGKLRRNGNTIVHGQRVAAVPYGHEFVTRVHSWMQIPEMYVAFGLLPPTVEQERAAQHLMAMDPDCFSFVVCRKEGQTLSPIGRAQLQYREPVARVHVGLVVPDLKDRVALHREVLAALCVFADSALPVKMLQQPAASAIKSNWADADGFGIPFVPGDSPTADLQLDLENAETQEKLASIAERITIQSYNPLHWSFADATDI